MDFVDSVDFSLEMDEIKKQVRELLDMAVHDTTALNIYWTRFSCGVRMKGEEGWKDLAYFSYTRSPVKVSNYIKMVVAISTGQLFVPFLIQFEG